VITPISILCLKSKSKNFCFIKYVSHSLGLLCAPKRNFITSQVSWLTNLLQLNDLRSTIAKEACITVSELVSKTAAGKSKGFPQTVLPVLFKNLIKTKKIFTESAHQCILSILKYCNFNLVASIIVEGANDKHHLLRTK